MLCFLRIKGKSKEDKVIVEKLNYFIASGFIKEDIGELSVLYLFFLGDKHEILSENELSKDNVL